MIDFAEVERSVRELKHQLAERKIDEKTFEKRLLEMIDMAEDGHYWMFGHQSERWFRHDGEKWTLEDPKVRLPFASQEKVYQAGRLPNSNSKTNTHGHISQQEDTSINWGWFIISLIMLVLIGGIVYYSALALYG